MWEKNISTVHSHVSRVNWGLQAKKTTAFKKVAAWVFSPLGLLGEDSNYVPDSKLKLIGLKIRNSINIHIRNLLRALSK
jgi:hypothetical protein